MKSSALAMLVVLAACHAADEPPRKPVAVPPAASEPIDATVDATTEAAAPIVDAGVDVGVWPNPTKGFVAKLHADVCFGDCAIFTVTVRDDGTFLVVVDSPRKGCIVGTAPLWKVGKIQALAHAAEFPKIRRTLDSGQNDRRWITTTITDFGATDAVKRWGSVTSDPSYATVIDIENAIIDATDAAELAQSGTLATCPKSTK